MKLIIFLFLGVLSLYSWYMLICFIDYFIANLPHKYLEFFHNLF